MKKHNSFFISNRFYKLSKRHSLLLEVLIALMIVSLAALPLIYPHVAIMREQSRLLHETHLDHFVNGLYANLTLQLYRNEIPWDALVQGRSFAVSPEALAEARLPYKGTYRLKITHTKPREPVDVTYNLVNLTIDFLPIDLRPDLPKEELAKKQLTFTYKIYIERKYEKAS